MEPAEPHGGGGGHAFPSGKNSSSLVESRGCQKLLPRVPAPLLNTSLDGEEPEDGENAAPDVLKEALEGRNRGSVLRPPKRLQGGKGAPRTPLSDINKQIQSLTNNVEKINKEEQTQQGTLAPS
jgi:hypothetical protein